MPKKEVHCTNCGETLMRWKSQVRPEMFCNKSCHRSWVNKNNNPSWSRDLSGKNNPMYGKHPKAWNKGLRGEDSHNWKGGLHKRTDGYSRITIDGERVLYHRYLKGLKKNDSRVVHHKDCNRENNNLDNLIVLSSQSEHASIHKK